MARYEELVRKAMEMNLEYDGNNTTDTRMLRGIGYAILALAQSIKDATRELADQLDYSKHAGHGGR